MYKFLLASRYLRTRFIALASIVSVTLGVATLIVVNSVMSGFVDEMKDRLHGILSDVEIASPGLGEITWPELHVQEIETIVGDDIEAITYVTRVPALLNLEYGDRQWSQQVMLLGVDEATFGRVTDFKPYLTNENKKKVVSFLLENDGYDQQYGESGWDYRREKFKNHNRVQNLIRQSLDHQAIEQVAYNEPVLPQSPAATNAGGGNDSPEKVVTSDGVYFAPLPDAAPDVEAVYQAKIAGQTKETAKETASGLPFNPTDPSAGLRPELAAEEMFDPARDQYTGIILGIAISERKYAGPDGEMNDLYMVRPGDDVQITFPSAGSNPKPVSENCTVVDFYSSNMHEYDSSFAFMPLKELQKLRGMIDPTSGQSSVSAIQIKVKEGANLSEIRDKLIQRFPPEQFPYVIQTWQDTQRPLLSAVSLEVTILNILLFLIIAVAGFGILATFYMIVVEKTKDIGILKALGAPSRGVMSIFLSYGLSLGAVGTGVGIILGLLFVYYINNIADVVQRITGQEIFDPTIYYFNEIPTIVSPMMVLFVALGAIAIAVLASVLPALRAARLHPVEALRYE